jgi:hypothetical protein
MSLLLHRSHRAETLAELLCGVLSARWPDDPFERVPIVVGSRGMERYLRHEIATRTGIAAGLAFPFPRPAFAGATRWLIDGAVEARAEFWELGEQPHKAAARFERRARCWSSTRTKWRACGALRARIGRHVLSSSAAPHTFTVVEGMRVPSSRQLE